MSNYIEKHPGWCKKFAVQKKLCFSPPPPPYPEVGASKCHRQKKTRHTDIATLWLNYPSALHWTESVKKVNIYFQLYTLNMFIILYYLHIFLGFVLKSIGIIQIFLKDISYKKNTIMRCVWFLFNSLTYIT